MTVTITGLDCGTLRTQQRTLLSGGSTDVIEIPVPGWLIRHTDGVVVFDVGLHPGLITSKDSLGLMAKLFDPVIAPGGTIGARLEQHDVDPSDPFTIVLSHCHFDHVGGLCELPNARVVVQADEWTAATAVDGGLGGYDSALIELGHDVLQVRGEHDVFGDGSVVCVPTPGHTCGHQSLRVETGDGPTILTADACYFTHTLDDSILPPFAHDAEQQLRSLDWLRAQRRSGVRLIPGHDADAFRSISS